MLRPSIPLVIAAATVDTVEGAVIGKPTDGNYGSSTGVGHPNADNNTIIPGINKDTTANDAIDAIVTYLETASTPYKQAVRTMTTGKLSDCVYYNGVNNDGVNSTLTGAIDGFLCDDTTSSIMGGIRRSDLKIGDRILIDSTGLAGVTVAGLIGSNNDVCNGIYTITNFGSLTTRWILTRASDASLNALFNGTTVLIGDGTNANKQYSISYNSATLTNPNHGAYKIGNDPIVWIPITNNSSGSSSGTTPTVLTNTNGLTPANNGPSTGNSYIFSVPLVSSDPQLEIYNFTLNNVDKTQYRTGQLYVGYTASAAKIVEKSIERTGGNSGAVTFTAEVINSNMFIKINITADVWNVKITKSDLLTGKISFDNITNQNLLPSVTNLKTYSIPAEPSLLSPNTILSHFIVTELASGNFPGYTNIIMGKLHFTWSLDISGNTVISKNSEVLLRFGDTTLLEPSPPIMPVDVLALVATNPTVEVNFTLPTALGRKYKVIYYDFDFSTLTSTTLNTNTSYTIPNTAVDKSANSFAKYYYFIQDNAKLSDLNNAKPNVTVGEILLNWDNINTTTLPYADNISYTIASSAGHDGTSVFNAMTFTADDSVPGVVSLKVNNLASSSMQYIIKLLKNVATANVVLPQVLPTTLQSTYTPNLTTPHILYTINKNNTNAVVFNYTASNSTGTAKRTAEIMTVFTTEPPIYATPSGNGTFTYNERTLIPDMGDVSGITFSVIWTGENPQFVANITNFTWNITFQVIDIVNNGNAPFNVSRIALNDISDAGVVVDTTAINDKGYIYYYLIKSVDGKNMRFGDLFTYYDSSVSVNNKVVDNSRYVTKHLINDNKGSVSSSNVSTTTEVYIDTTTIPSSENNYYVGAKFYTAGMTAFSELRTITNYDGILKKITVSPALPAAPAAGLQYYIVDDSSPLGSIGNTESGTFSYATVNSMLYDSNEVENFAASSAGALSNTFELNGPSSSGTAHYYVGSQLMIISDVANPGNLGYISYITSYNNSTHFVGLETSVPYAITSGVTKYRIVHRASIDLNVTTLANDALKDGVLSMSNLIPNNLYGLSYDIDKSFAITGAHRVVIAGNWPLSAQPTISTTTKIGLPLFDVVNNSNGYVNLHFKNYLSDVVDLYLYKIGINGPSQPSAQPTTVTSLTGPNTKYTGIVGVSSGLKNGIIYTGGSSVKDFYKNYKFVITSDPNPANVNFSTTIIAYDGTTKTLTLQSNTPENTTVGTTAFDIIPYTKNLIHTFNEIDTIIPDNNTVDNPNRYPERIASKILHYIVYESATSSGKTGELYIHWLSNAAAINDRSTQLLGGSAQNDIVGFTVEVESNPLDVTSNTYKVYMLLNYSAAPPSYTIKFIPTLTLSNYTIPPSTISNVVNLSTPGEYTIRRYDSQLYEGIHLFYILSALNDGSNTTIRKRMGTLMLTWNKDVINTAIISDSYLAYKNGVANPTISDIGVLESDPNIFAPTYVPPSTATFGDTAMVQFRVSYTVSKGFVDLIIKINNLPLNWKVSLAETRL